MIQEGFPLSHPYMQTSFWPLNTTSTWSNHGQRIYFMFLGRVLWWQTTMWITRNIIIIKWVVFLIGFYYNGHFGLLSNEKKFYKVHMIKFNFKLKTQNLMLNILSWMPSFIITFILRLLSRKNERNDREKERKTMNKVSFHYLKRLSAEGMQVECESHEKTCFRNWTDGKWDVRPYFHQIKMILRAVTTPKLCQKHVASTRIIYAKPPIKVPDESRETIP